jgi:hypothetical protein
MQQLHNCTTAHLRNMQCANAKLCNQMVHTCNTCTTCDQSESDELLCDSCVVLFGKLVFVDTDQCCASCQTCKTNAMLYHPSRCQHVYCVNCIKSMFYVACPVVEPSDYMNDLTDLPDLTDSTWLAKPAGQQYEKQLQAARFEYQLLLDDQQCSLCQLAKQTVSV